MSELVRFSAKNPPKHLRTARARRTELRNIPGHNYNWGHDSDTLEYHFLCTWIRDFMGKRYVHGRWDVDSEILIEVRKMLKRLEGNLSRRDAEIIEILDEYIGSHQW